MSRRSTLALVRSAAAPALAVMVIGYFGAAALFGANGLFALGDYRRQYSLHAAELAQLDTQRAQMAHRVRLLDPRHADPDMADELVRRQLGLARPDEVILELK